MNKITKFPVNAWTRFKNKLGKYAAPCHISNRWIKFHQYSSRTSSGDLITFDVMTTNENNKQKKLCELVVSREDLFAAINNVKVKKNV